MPRACVRVQVLIHWALERGCSVLPKSTNEGRIAANLAVCDWDMAEEDVQALGSLSYRVRGGAGVAVSAPTLNVTTDGLWCHQAAFFLSVGAQTLRGLFCRRPAVNQSQS